MYPSGDISSIIIQTMTTSYMLLQITTVFWHTKLHPKLMSASSNSDLDHRKFFIQFSTPAVDVPLLHLRASLSQHHFFMNSSSNVSTVGSETVRNSSSCHCMKHRHRILNSGLLLIWVVKTANSFLCVYVYVVEENCKPCPSTCFLNHKMLVSIWPCFDCSSWVHI